MNKNIQDKIANVIITLFFVILLSLSAFVLLFTDSTGALPYA